MYKKIISLILFAATVPLAQAVDGAGSSAAAPLYKKWAEVYAGIGGGTVNYEASGSSAGLKRVKAGQVDFGASDVALSQRDLNQSNLIQFPSAISGVVPVYNLPGLKSGELKLTGELLANIFAGTITEWNDPAIAAVNPGVRLPGKAIVGVVRQDGSGTTYHFTDYLCKVSQAWDATFRHDFTIRWHERLVQVKGSGQVAALVKKTPYALGYVDYNYVIQHKLDAARLQNRAGKFVTASASAFSAALASSAWKKSGNFEETLTDQAMPTAWPITMGSFVLLPRVARHTENSIEVLKFFGWAFLHGDRLVDHVDLVRLPDAIQARAFKEMMRAADKNGDSLRWALQ